MCAYLFCLLIHDVTSAAGAWTCPACAGCATAHAHVAQPTCASASCYCVFKTEKTSVVGYFIAKYAKMPFSTVTLQVVYNEINHLSY